MTSYLTQPEDSTICGPVAIINVGRWSKHPVKKSLKDICEEVQCDSGGTPIRHIDKSLRKEFKKKLKVIKKRYCSVNEAKKHIEKGNALLLSFLFKNNEEEKDVSEHICLFTKVKDKKWYAHNLSFKKRTSIILEEDMYEYFYRWGRPHIWLLKKI